MRSWSGWLFVIALGACRPDAVLAPIDSTPLPLVLPAGFPDPVYPDDNQPTVSRIALGEKLFFDVRLSRDSSLSCAHCHLPQKAFSDGKVKSLGVLGREGLRNAPGLFNIAYAARLMRDGGVPSLELQVLAPIQDVNEMNHNPLKIEQSLENDQVLQNLSQKAYGRRLDTYVLIRAIAAYERTLISAFSAYDAFMAGDSGALNPSEQRGMALFFSDRTQCASCHGNFDFRDSGYFNVGLYQVYKDEGRGRISLLAGDAGKFKVPSLRNVALTAPYMHDGSLATLEEVLIHFNQGGKTHPNKDSRIRALGLSQEELSDLQQFLESLSDYKLREVQAIE